jgi:hypothetical protein
MATMKNATYYATYLARKPEDHQGVDDWFYNSERDSEDVMEEHRVAYAHTVEQVREASAQQLRDWWCSIRGRLTGVKSSGKLMKKDLVQFVIEIIGRF